MCAPTFAIVLTVGKKALFPQKIFLSKKLAYAGFFIGIM